MSDAEKRLWYLLRDRRLGYKFRRQVPIGPYIVDFACKEACLAIEIDGGQHSENQEEDRRRTIWLEWQGWHVMRFWNNEVLQQTEVVTGKNSYVFARGVEGRLTLILTTKKSIISPLSQRERASFS